MRSLWGYSVCGLAALLSTASVQTSASEAAAGQYSGIAARNVFGLKPPPQSAETPPPPLPRVVLAGIITTLLGNDRALLKEQLAPAGAGGAAREISMILAEGQREGDIEVLRIDQATGAVHIRNCGNPMTLTFGKEGAKLPVTRPPVTGPPSPPEPPVSTVTPRSEALPQGPGPSEPAGH